MFILMTVTVFSLQDITTSFSRTTGIVERGARESQRIWEIESRIVEMSLAVHNYTESGGPGHRGIYESARTALHNTLGETAKLDLGNKESSILASLSGYLREFERTADRIFSIRLPAGANHVPANNLIIELDGLQEWMNTDMERFQQEHAVRMSTVMDQLRDEKRRINQFFLMILTATAVLLLAFGIYLHHKVSVPLSELWKGTGEISRGNLDYRIEVTGARDIALLAERFNEMALKLKRSYGELEEKLLGRTRELAALDAVALTLSQAGNLKDLLQKSLLKILDGIPGLDHQGGVFLCDQQGEHLRLTVHHGLPADFVKREETIKMGECLCGMVAQTGEMLVTNDSCDDPRHTRSRGAGPHSHIIIPIKSRGIVLGVIFLYPNKSFTLQPSDIQLLDAVGAQLGMAVENFRFYAEVKNSSEKYWDLFENSRDILFTMDQAGGLTAVNRAAEKFTGYSKVELVGKNIMDFLTPEGAASAREVLSGKLGRRRNIEFEIIHRNIASRAFVEVSVRRLGKNRAPAGFHVSARDVTDQKALREMLLKAERLAAIGQLGIAVRHEINNPLTTIIGNVEVLIEQFEDKDKKLTARLESVLNNALRIAEIVKRMQEIKQDKVVEYLKGVNMTDLK